MPADPFVSAAHRDPLISYTFGVDFTGKLAGKTRYFREVSGIGSENTVITSNLDAGGKRIPAQKQPGQAKYTNITLKRGVTEDLSLWEWRQLIIDGKIKDNRSDGSIFLFDQAGTEVARWNFQYAWPTKISGPQFSSTGNEVAVEEMTLVVESIKRTK
jgi:phage tail-like protein